MLHFFTYVNKHKDILVDQIRYDTLQRKVSQCDLTRSTTPGQHMKNSQHRHTNTQKFRCSHSGTGKKNRSVLKHSLLELNSLSFSTRSFDKYGCYSQTFTWDLMTRRPNWVRHTPIHSLTHKVCWIVCFLLNSLFVILQRGGQISSPPIYKTFIFICTLIRQELLHAPEKKQRNEMKAHIQTQKQFLYKIRCPHLKCSFKTPVINHTCTPP